MKKRKGRTRGKEGYLEIYIHYQHHKNTKVSTTDPLTAADAQCTPCAEGHTRSHGQSMAGPVEIPLACLAPLCQAPAPGPLSPLSTAHAVCNYQHRFQVHVTAAACLYPNVCAKMPTLTTNSHKTQKKIHSCHCIIDILTQENQGVNEQGCDLKQK